jgi:hypothetical protein
MTNEGSSEFFISKIPPGTHFQLYLDDIKEIALNMSNPTDGLDTLRELCIIGLVAYFEAFIKNTFAACGNICPRLLVRFAEKRRTGLIRPKDIISLDQDVRRSLGFIMADQMSFSSPRKINHEPPRVFRRLVGLSHATMAGSSIVA